MRRLCFLALSIALLLSACGYKGPLYLPKEEPAKPATADHAPATQQDNKQ